MSLKKLFLLFSVCGMFLVSGCATLNKADQADRLQFENEALREELVQLKKIKETEVAGVVQKKDKELQNLEKAKLALEEQLKKEIGEYKAKLEMTERGLVITFLSEIFFDSGKDEIRNEGRVSLDKVSDILNRNVPGSLIAIEGHTDNDPIRYSGWKSNWELSTARAVAVVHYLIDGCKVEPQRLSAVGYGEYRPIISNDAVSGRQQNRRVEIVILPSQVKKIKDK